MRKSKMKKACTMLALTLAGIVSINGKVYASNLAQNIKPLEYTDEFKEYIKSDEEEIFQPRMFEIQEKDINFYNPFKLARIVGSNLETKYNLSEVIPENVIVKKQEETDSCWAFATLSSLETNLALKNEYNGISPIGYNFSERHVEYATSRTFKDGAINPNSFNRTVGGGNWYISSAYLTNGTGAINESAMPFLNSEELININELQGKTVTSQVYDTVEFPSTETTKVTEDLIKDIKNHIKNYGSVFASIHGASIFSDYYNNTTGAIYCDNTVNCPVDHAVSIIGWIDNYDVTNFNSLHRPNSSGAWIIKNSWGEGIEYDLAELKAEFFETFEEECIENGYTDATMVPDEIIAEYGYRIEGNKAILPIGDDGIMYVSYEDVNIYSNLYGIVKASDYTDYENIYQYNYLGYSNGIVLNASKVYVGNIFNKKTNGTEYLTQIGLNILEDCTCKVYVNSLNTNLDKNSLKPVTLKSGISETLDGAGYHTLEFAEPVEIKGNFAVVVEIQGTETVLVESKVVGTAWSDVQIENEKTFITYDSYFEQNEWVDLGKMSQANISLPNGDSTIKAFTTSKVDDNTLKEIEVTTKPKTEYYVGENFDKTGMVVTAYYNNGRTNIIDGYSIENGTNLQLGQTSVTIKYQDKSVELPITVEENSAVSIVVKTPPTNTEYKAGENFDKTGMVIEATYKDGTSKEITDYEITDGINLKNGQTTITIEYQGMTATQAITVIPNPVVGLEIQKGPDKVDYVVGQDFDKTGMIVIATYQDGTEIELEDYIIENGTNLTKEQTSVTIKFEDQTVIQSITVVEKAIVSIQVKDMPEKTQYIQNKESLDLAGGTLLVKYNDGAEETISMTDEKVTVTGFNNTELGKVQITLTYETKTVTFEVEIIKGETAENSNFDNAKCEVLKVKSYAYTDPAKEEYIIMELEVEDIVKSLKNDSLEYYYYLSANQSESNIQDWVKIQESQNNNNKIVFKVNTKDIANYQDLISSDVLYLYIKEVAVKGGDQKVAISKSMLVEAHVDIEEYLDDVKQDPNAKPDEDETKEDDDTISKDKIPNAGKTFIIVLVVIGTCGILLISLKKYRGLKDVK